MEAQLGVDKTRPQSISIKAIETHTNTHIQNHIHPYSQARHIIVYTKNGKKNSTKFGLLTF